ncbi:MAG: hypothetical protein RR894_18285 [Terrisporobacter sp.]
MKYLITSHTLISISLQIITNSLAWYEQKSVIVLLAFLSPNVAKVLVENFGIGCMTNVKDDIKMFLEQ